MAEIRSLQACRALAALAVVAYHAGIAVPTFDPSAPEILGSITSRGYLGVDLFFVLSGFIIYHVSHGKTATFEWFKSFLGRRSIRVFVPYLPIGIGLAVLYSLYPEVSAANRDWGWFSTLTLLPSPENPALVVAWTLQREIIFYGVFAIGFMLRRPILATASLALVDPLYAEFLFGVLAAFAVATGRVKYAPILGAFGLGLFLGFGALESHRILFAAVAACGLGVLARFDNRFQIPGWLVFLGGASYAIYLVHAPLGSVAVRIADDWPLALGAFVLFGLGGGVAYHLGFERPALRHRWRPIASTSPASLP